MSWPVLLTEGLHLDAIASEPHLEGKRTSLLNGDLDIVGLQCFN